MSHHHVVAIGGSYGAIDAAQRLIRGLPADFAAAVLVVIHIGSDSPGTLHRVLGRDAQLTVSAAVDGEAVERGHVYVAPPDHHLLLVDGVLRLGRGPRENMARPSVDPLFRSVAMSVSSRAVGVVLTGLLDDGASGLAEIKRFGGITAVQTPGEATAPGMPLAALRAADVDYRGSIEQLATLLIELAARPAGLAVPATDDLRLEVEIALGNPVTSKTIARIADPSELSCPACGGVLSQMKDQSPVRFRCQVGHGYTAEVLLSTKEAAVDEGLRVALRIVEERAVLTEKMASQARNNGHASSAQSYEARAREYRTHAEVLRRAALAAQ